jgi:hypothetical protein
MVTIKKINGGRTKGRASYKYCGPFFFYLQPPPHQFQISEEQDCLCLPARITEEPCATRWSAGRAASPPGPAAAAMSPPCTGRSPRASTVPAAPGPEWPRPATRWLLAKAPPPQRGQPRPPPCARSCDAREAPQRRQYRWCWSVPSFPWFLVRCGVISFIMG